MSFANLTPQAKEVTYKGLAAFAVACLVIALGMPLRWLFFKSPLPFPVVVPIFFVAAVAHSFWRMGWRRMVVFLPLALVVCTLAELVSTYSGFPFGEYVYNPDRVGRVALWTVPLTVPMAWFTMIYPSLIIANLLVDGHPRTGSPSYPRLLMIAVVGAGVVTVWDLALDPHMVNYESAWTWRYADTCRQQTCRESLGNLECARGCKDVCTRPESRGQCRERLEEEAGGDAVDMTLCTRANRVEFFVTRCAAQCEASAADGHLDAACEELVSSASVLNRQRRELTVERVQVEGGKKPLEKRQELMVRFEDHAASCKTLKKQANWKLACEGECCDQECQDDCAAAIPILSHDDAWWEDQGGEVWVVRGTAVPTWMRNTFGFYFERGWYFCIPFSNFYGWLLTSFSVFVLYGLAKKWWIVAWEQRAQSRRAQRLLLAWSHDVPDHLALFPAEGSIFRNAIKKATALPRLAELDVKIEASPLTNVQKLTTLGGMGIYFGVSWCNVLFAYPSGLVLIALFGMLLPLLAAIFRLYAWKGETSNLERMYGKPGE